MPPVSSPRAACRARGPPPAGPRGAGSRPAGPPGEAQGTIAAGPDDARPRHDAAVGAGAGPRGGRGPRIELLRNDDPKVAKNRVHLDVAPGAADDHGAEVDRLRALGATDADVGQGRRPWTVLADPHGNELCVLPRAEDATQTSTIVEAPSTEPPAP